MPTIGYIRTALTLSNHPIAEGNVWHNKYDHHCGNYLTDIKGILRVG
mgnify:CR=1 FL=1